MAPPDPRTSPFLDGVRTFVFRQLRLGVGLGLLVLLSVNYGVRAQGGSVHLLSPFRVRDRASALAQFALHRVRCRCEDREAQQVLREAALRHGVSYRLALSVARTESSLIHTRISGTGAMGIMQLMPDTARELGVSDPFALDQNVDAGVRYLKQLMVTYRGNMRRALAAYNAGPGRIARRGPLHMPHETRGYVARVIAGL